MIDYASLFKRIQPYRVTRDEDMPAPYRRRARFLSDDFPFWPLTRIPRMRRAYRLPMPPKQLEGNMEPRWHPWFSEDYPLAPEARIEDRDWYNGTDTVRVKHILSVDPVPEKAGQWSLQAVWLDGKWEPCYLTWKKKILGKVWAHNRGLRPEPAPDTMWWFPEWGGPH